MMSQVLLSITNEEAVVADNVTTYKREDVVNQLQVYSASIQEARDKIPQLEAQVQQLKQQLANDTQQYELLSALLEQFNSRFPVVEKPVEVDSSVVEDVSAQSTKTKKKK